MKMRRENEQSHEEERKFSRDLASMIRLQHAGCSMAVLRETPVLLFYEEK